MSWTFGNSGDAFRNFDGVELAMSIAVAYSKAMHGRPQKFLQGEAKISAFLQHQPDFFNVV